MNNMTISTPYFFAGTGKIKNVWLYSDARKFMLNLAIDGTGFGPNARSEYIRRKYKVKHGFIRTVIVADTDTGEILAVSVTRETVGGVPQFENLMDAAPKFKCHTRKQAGTGPTRQSHNWNRRRRV